MSEAIHTAPRAITDANQLVCLGNASVSQQPMNTA